MDFTKSEQYIIAHKAETINTLCRFLATDTLLFWSNEQDLYAYQKKHWQPLLDKLNTVFKLDLQITADLNPADNSKAKTIFEQHLNNLTARELTGCFLAASELKSVLLGLLLAKQKITVTEAVNAAFLEEIFQNLSWGEDVAALNAREKTEKHLEQIAECLKK